MKSAAAVLSVVVLIAVPALAETVTVEVTGQVIFNGIGDPPLGDINSGENVVMSFTVDSNNFDEGVPGDTRGYLIDESSFSLSFSSGLDMGLADPFPAGEKPYFTLVEGFPVSDGFFVSISPTSPGGVPLEQDPFNLNLDLGYDGGTLDSLDILDAVGVYDFDGLTRFGFNLWAVFPDNVAMEMDFAQMTIVPEPATMVLLAPFGLLMFRRRRRQLRSTL